MHKYARALPPCNEVKPRETSNDFSQVVSHPISADMTKAVKPIATAAGNARVYPEGDLKVFSEDGCYVLPYYL
jgi:hypothetical protein